MSAPIIVALVAVVLGLPAATYYPFMFLKVRWWESWIGSSMLTKGIALMLVFWIAILSVPAYYLDWGWFRWVSSIVDWWLAGAVWFQVVVMRKVQREGELHERISTKLQSGDRDVKTTDS